MCQAHQIPGRPAALLMQPCGSVSGKAKLHRASPSPPATLWRRVSLHSTAATSQRSLRMARPWQIHCCQVGGGAGDEHRRTCGPLNLLLRVHCNSQPTDSRTAHGCMHACAHALQPARCSSSNIGCSSVSSASGCSMQLVPYGTESMGPPSG